MSAAFALFIFLVIGNAITAVMSVQFFVKALERKGFPIAYQSHDLELADPANPSQKLNLHVTMAGFVLAAQSNVTAFAKLQLMEQDRMLNSDEDRSIPEKYFLWFNGSYCPPTPVDLYSTMLVCQLELERYPKDNVSWSNVYWQGTYSDFPNEFTYSTIGIRYPTDGIYGVTLRDSTNDSETASLSHSFIEIADAGVTHTFFLGIESNQVALVSLGISLMVLAGTMFLVNLKIYEILKRRGAFDRTIHLTNATLLPSITLRSHLINGTAG